MCHDVFMVWIEERKYPGNKKLYSSKKNVKKCVTFSLDGIMQMGLRKTEELYLR